MNRKKIPADLKRKVLVEAGHRCAVPTCRSVVGVDIHHIVPWNKRKEHKYPNLIALCPNCHRMAEKGDIDKKSLYLYKNNLRFLYDKFTTFEVDLLYELVELNPEEKHQFLPFLKLLIKRIMEAGYITYEETMAQVAMGNIKLNPDLIKITSSGRQFIQDISSKNIGY
jgi:hypothetical protein